MDSRLFPGIPGKKYNSRQNMTFQKRRFPALRKAKTALPLQFGLFPNTVGINQGADGPDRERKRIPVS